MGGCCSSSRKPYLHGTPVYYYCPPALEEQDLLTSHDGATSVFPAGLLVHLDLETSVIDTYRAPPTPLPYDLVLRRPQSTDSELARETISGSCGENLGHCQDHDELGSKIKSATLPLSPKKLELSSNENCSPVTEEDDDCPICLEDYDVENPKMITNCEHNFHLSCILEWMERSETCPICDQELVFDH